jgi:vacuolar-type H+-ATPase subunit I/STV1
MDAYTEAHLIVAAIRLFEHKNGTLPKIEDICTMLGISDEAGHTVCRRLAKLGIIDTLEDPFSIKVSVANHLEIEKIPRDSKEDKGLAKEIEKFQAQKMKAEKRVADIQAELAKKQKDKLAAIEAKFKKDMEKYKKD